MLARKHGRQAGGRPRCPPAHTGRNFLLRTASEAGEEGVANGTTCVACGRGCGTRARGVSLSELLGPGGSQACPALRPAQACSRPDQARGETGLMQPCCSGAARNFLPSRTTVAARAAFLCLVGKRKERETPSTTVTTAIAWTCPHSAAACLRGDREHE
jgi:hypothetical protein